MRNKKVKGRDCVHVRMGTKPGSVARGSARELLRRRIERVRRKRAAKRCEFRDAEQAREEEGFSAEEQEKAVEEEEEDEGTEEEEEEESGVEDGEGEAHTHLLSAISDLGRQRRRGQRSEATPTVSQFQLTNRDGEGVKVGGLLKGVEETDVATLRRQLATPSNHQLLPPATSRQMEKVHRALAYSSACRDVGKWLPVVTHNRKAPHLSFPLQEETVPSPSLSSRSEDFQAVTELERAVQGVLGKSAAVVEAPDAELTASERVELVRVMGEEGRERVRESRKWRMLMSQYEAKCQRERRIKSRRFHKVQRRRREKAREEGEEEKEEKAERLRARERMTLKHGRQGRWAREVLARGRRDPAARAALSEHSQRGHALTLHQPPPESEEESNSAEEQVRDGSPPPPLQGIHGNPWLQSALSLNSDPTSNPVPVVDGDGDKMEEQESNFDPTKQLIEDASDEQTPPPTQSDDVTKLTSSSTTKQSSVPVIDPTAYLTPSEKVGVALGVASEQLLQVHEAFAGDDVVGEFKREKREAEATEAEEMQLELPGWGAWGGEGARPKKKLTKPHKKEKPHSDREPGHVIIGDRDNRKINKHLVKKLPWPFSNAQQFTRTQATPLGRHWNSEVVHREMVTPRVETAVGVAIPPLKLTDDVQDFMKSRGKGRHQVQRRRLMTEDKHNNERI